MINKNINNNNNIYIYEKLNNIYLSNINNIHLNKLTISLIIPSNIRNINGFITMMILLEKNINNKPIFLFDCHTLSRNRVIKIGLTIVLYSEILNHYLHLCMEYSMPRIIENNIIFNIPILYIYYFYNYNKMLINTIFSFDNEMYLYYVYLNNLSYTLEFIFSTTSRNKLINLLIISLNNTNITAKNENIIYMLSENAKIAALESEFDDDFISKSDDEFDIDYLSSDELDNQSDDEFDIDDNSDGYYASNESTELDSSDEDDVFDKDDEFNENDEFDEYDRFNEYEDENEDDEFDIDDKLDINNLSDKYYNVLVNDEDRNIFMLNNMEFTILDINTTIDNNNINRIKLLEDNNIDIDIFVNNNMGILIEYEYND